RSRLRGSGPWGPSCGREPAASALVGAAGAAAVPRVRPRLLALCDLERMAAAAGGGDVRVRDLEAGLLDRLQVVDLGTAQVRSAEGIDDDGDAVRLELEVALLGAPVEAERILESRTAAALDGDAQDACLTRRLLHHQPPDLDRGLLRQRHDRVGALDDLHDLIVPAGSAATTSAGQPRL